jgi:hypothetical protein
MRLAAVCVALTVMVTACAANSKDKPPMEPTAETASGLDSDAGEAEGDGGTSGEGASTAAADDKGGNSAILHGDADGARALLSQFVAPNADHLALTRSLRPTTSDYKSLFDAATASKIEAAHAKDWDSGKAVIKPKPGQTEIKIWGASGADLATGKGDAKEFPGGYKKVGKHLVATQLFFRFKFVEAGKDQGTAYDGLAFVNNHWVIAPKPWKAVDGKGGVSGDDDADTAGDKPKPKKKKKKKKLCRANGVSPWLLARRRGAGCFRVGRRGFARA